MKTNEFDKMKKYNKDVDKMKKEIVGWGMVRCLHCGELVKLDGDIHLCDAPDKEWVNNQKVAVLQMSDGTLLNLKDSQND